MKIRIVDNFLLVDGDNLFYRIRYALNSVDLDEILKGIRTSIRFLEGKFLDNFNKMIIVWDAGHSGRNKILATYKKQRQNKPIEELKEISELKKLVKYALSNDDGYINFEIKGYECDDIIASFVNLITKFTNLRVVIVSEDKDFLQLISKNCVLFRPVRNRECSLSNFKEITGLNEPKDYIKYLAIVGDRVDGIPGISGIGEKRAKLYLTNKNKLSKHILDKIESEKEIYNLCYKLVKFKKKIYNKHNEIRHLIMSLGIKLKCL
jgi:DNA polymerase-1